MILPIDRWVLREACKQAREWQDAGLPFKRVSVNASASEFRTKTFLEDVGTILRETGLEARYLDLELTEAVLMQNAESTASVLQELKSMGVHLETSCKVSGFMTDADKQLGRRTIRVEDESRFAILMPLSSTCQRNVTDSEMVALSFTPSNR